ncbi:MAG: hypothetical protein IJA74_01745 [Oscillospiraceae bacterium]|nr:hypothetical protein [Oscillospiraceae bacterium]
MANRVDIQYVQFYSADSTAKRIAPAIPVHTGALPQIKKRKVRRVYLDPVAALGIVVAVSMMIMMLVGLSQLRSERNRLAVMEQQVEILHQKNMDLQAQYEKECNIDQVKEIALALGMVPGREVAHSSIEVELPQTEEPVSVSIWNRIGTFLTGLFA